MGDKQGENKIRESKDGFYALTEGYSLPRDSSLPNFR